MKNRQPKHKKIKIFESAMRPSLVKKKKQFNHFKMDWNNLESKNFNS